MHRLLGDKLLDKGNVSKSSIEADDAVVHECRLVGNLLHVKEDELNQAMN